MPFYEYKCKTCGKVFEIQQKITEDALTHCPNEVCDQKVKGQGIVERKISKNIGLVFNGSGFYLTDYANRHESSYTVSKKNHKPAAQCENCQHNNCDTKTA